MRSVWVVLVSWLFVACDSAPGAREAAVHVDVSYDFNAGCIVVLARDKAAPEKEDRKQALVFNRDPRKADFAVYRGEDWGRTVEITVSARERTCEGPEVASSGVREYTLEKAGTQTLEVALSAPDADGDGYVASASGGTDCDDGHAMSFPGGTEVCDGRDNDCANGIDDGLSLTDFFLDGDGDGVGAGPVVKACAAPPNHVASSGDCDDSTDTRTPGKAEICDGVDNDCDDIPDDGLTFTDYFLDSDGDGVGAGAAVRACAPLANHVTTSGDCDDNNNARTPGKAEICDELDNDCNSVPDDGLPTNSYYRDADGDTFGDPADEVQRCRAPTGYVAGTPVLDCDDTKASVNPNATEVCNDVDDNCVGGVDEGFDKNWYRDVDMDGFGDPGDMQMSCTQPAGYVSGTPGFDCNDALASVNPNAIEVCNDVDDNCFNGVDENFPNKGSACNSGICTGQFVCNAAQDDTECNAPAPVSYYPDADGDGEGQMGSVVEEICPPAPPPANKVQNQTDCDDQDPRNKSMGTEICDDRDNNCANGKSDEVAVCEGKGWKVLTDPAVTIHTWNTVAVGTNGEPVWIAGDNGALAVRLAGSTSFLDRHQQCGTTKWNAAWVRPGDGQVFLAGDGGSLATYNAISPCVTASTTSATGTTSNRDLLGIIGFGPAGSTTVYVVNDRGFVFAWTPGSAPNPVFNVERGNDQPYRDIHGVTASRMFPVGNTGGDPTISVYDAVTAGNSLGTQSVTGIPGANNGHVLGVWAIDSARAYAVGEKGILLMWDGTSTWSFISPDDSMKEKLRSVVAFDASSIYTASDAGRILRPTQTGWVEHGPVGGNLRDIAGMYLPDRLEIWAVGGGGRVVHFPEAP